MMELQFSTSKYHTRASDSTTIKVCLFNAHDANRSALKRADQESESLLSSAGCSSRGRETCHAPRISNPKQHLIHLTPLYRKQEIQHNPHNRSDNERRLDDQIDPLQKPLQMHIAATKFQHLVEPRRRNDVDEANAECDGQDEAITPGELDHAEDTDTGNGDGAVKEDLHAAEDGRRHGREDSAEFGEEAHEDEEA